MLTGSFMCSSTMQLCTGLDQLRRRPSRTSTGLIGVNLRGTFLGIKAAIAPMRASEGGSIINIASIAGIRGLPLHASYGASKWGDPWPDEDGGHRAWAERHQGERRASRDHRFAHGMGRRSEAPGCVVRAAPSGSGGRGGRGRTRRGVPGVKCVRLHHRQRDHDRRGCDIGDHGATAALSSTMTSGEAVVASVHVAGPLPVEVQGPRRQGEDLAVRDSCSGCVRWRGVTTPTGRSRPGTARRTPRGPRASPRSAAHPRSTSRGWPPWRSAPGTRSGRRGWRRRRGSCRARRCRTGSGSSGW